MATLAVFTECVNGSKELGLRPTLSRKSLSYLFGVVKLVSESEFMKSSEAEKNRHLFENRVLRALYIKDDPEFRGPFKRGVDVKHKVDAY